MVLALGVAGPSVAGAAVGTDPMLAQQWALADPAAIGAQEAWTQSTGAGVLVAVLDTGVQVNHPDLAGSVWTNPGEVAGNGRDDDARSPTACCRSSRRRAARFRSSSRATATRTCADTAT